MIDLHSHILPGIDDGARDVTDSLAMARIAVADGISVMACTPHIVPGLYENTAAGIRAAVGALRIALQEAGIPLRICVGADVHVAPDLPKSLAERRIPTLNGSRYFLFEPPHHVLPPKLDELVERLIEAEFVPILTHPERLTWVQSHYPVLERLNALGCLMQVTAGSLTGAFGKSAKLYADRLLDEGRVDIVATDAHNLRSRAPILSNAYRIVESRLGRAEADEMFLRRPEKILLNRDVTPASRSPRSSLGAAPRSSSWLGRLFRRTVE